MFVMQPLRIVFFSQITKILESLLQFFLTFFDNYKQNSILLYFYSVLSYLSGLHCFCFANLLVRTSQDFLCILLNILFLLWEPDYFLCFDNCSFVSGVYCFWNFAHSFIPYDPSVCKMPWSLLMILVFSSAFKHHTTI